MGVVIEVAQWVVAAPIAYAGANFAEWFYRNVW